jgi:hypothetical protein
MQRYSIFLIVLALGLFTGLYYGWVINPVESISAKTDDLRQDYRSDYVLMAAEIYQSEQNAQAAIDRLDFLNFDNPLEAISLALEFSESQSFEKYDINIISDLDAAIRAWDPRLAATPTP